MGAFRRVSTATLLTWLVAFTAVLVSGCTSTAPSSTSGIILDYQRQIAILEGRIGSFESGFGEIIESLDCLTDRGVTLTGGIDEIIILFDEYQRRVDELISIYRALTESSLSEN